jgi:hypothetical protein
MQLSVLERSLLTRLYAFTEREIEAAGYRVRVETDFEEVRKEIERAGKKLMPFFWSSYFQANNHNGFCFVLEKDGVGVSYICTRLIDCGAMNFHDVYISLLKAIYTHDNGAQLDPNWVCEPMLKINGKVAYSGDAVVDKDHRTMVKSAKALGLVSKLSLYFSVMMWPEISWVVGTIAERDISRGLAWYYGAASVYPMAECWLTLPEGRNANYALAASSRQEILYGAKAAIRQLEQQVQTENTSASEDR